MRAVVLVVLAGCFGTARAPSAPVPITPPPPTAPVFAALARADLVAELDDNELAAYAITNDKLAELGRIRIAPPREDGDYPADSALAWIDREHVVVQAGDVFVVSATGVEKLTVPTDDRFEGVPPPKSDDENLVRGNGGHPVVRGGKVYWRHCTWGLPYDGFQCEAWARIQIWPKAAQRVEDDDGVPAADAGARWRDAPAAFALGKTDQGVPTCKVRGGADVELARPANGDDDNKLVGGTTWLPGSPPAVLVEYGGMGLDYYADSFAVFDRCSETPVIRGSSYALFADGLWAALELVKLEPPTYASRLRRGLVLVGELPPNQRLALRPR